MHVWIPLYLNPLGSRFYLQPLESLYIMVLCNFPSSYTLFFVNLDGFAVNYQF